MSGDKSKDFVHHSRYYTDITRIRKHAAEEKKTAAVLFKKSEHYREKAQRATQKAVITREKIEAVKGRIKRLYESIDKLKVEMPGVEAGSKREAHKVKIAKLEYKISKYRLKMDSLESKAASLVDKSAVLREKSSLLLRDSEQHKLESEDLTKRADRLEMVDVESGVVAQNQSPQDSNDEE